MASTAPDTRPIATLQAGRALAALAVVVLHAKSSTEVFIGAPPPAVAAVAEFGYLGVDFFFVLSGFIIFHTSAGRSQRSGWRRSFAVGRLVRIFVPYLPVGLGMALLYSFAPGVGLRDAQWSWLSTVTLLPTGAPPALTVAWTLQHELVFYALAFLFLGWARPLLLAALWATAIAGWWLAFGGLDRPPTQSVAAVLLHPINLEFLFGMAAAWMVRNRRFDRPLLLCLVGSAFILLFFAAGATKPLSVIFGLGIAFLVPVLVRIEQAGRISVPRWLQLLGDASYALFLVHNPLISVSSRIVAAVAPHWLAGICAGLAASVAGSLIFYLAYERPARAWVRRLSGTGRDPLQAPPVHARPEL